MNSKMNYPRRRAIIIFLVLIGSMLMSSMALAQTGTTHVVEPGETLFSIAVQHSTDVDSIAFANGITNPDLIYVGQILTIPGGTGTSQPVVGGTYTVQSGDTLYSIARQFNTTIDSLAALNNILTPNLIQVGDNLSIPGNGTEQPAAPQPTTAPPVQPTSAPVATQPTPTSPTVQNSSYTVQAGDTLYHIAVRYDTSVQNIVQINGLANPNLIYPGQVLLISQVVEEAEATQTPIPTATFIETDVTETPEETDVPDETEEPAEDPDAEPTEFMTPTPIASDITFPNDETNLLVNPGFEGNTRNVFFENVTVANGWEPYYCAQPYSGAVCDAPEDADDPDGMMGRPVFGVTSQSGSNQDGQTQYWSCNSDTCRAGVFQIISTTPGMTCKAGALVKSWSAPAGSLASTARQNSYWFIRIDHAGGTDAFAVEPEFLLSRGFDADDGHYDGFVEINYIFQTTSEKTSIFFENLRLQPQENNFSYIDSAYLICTQG